MNYHRQLTAPARLVLLAVLGLVTLLLVPKLSKATGAIGKEDLAGPWQIALGGNTGCGVVSMLFNGTLNSAGTGSGTLVSHGACGDSSSGQTFTIISLSPNGSGKAGLTCGPGCGWTLTIQVSPDRSTFNLVDVNPPDGTGGILVGMAVHQ